MKKVLFGVLFTGVSWLSFSQNYFSGTIIYSASASGEVEAAKLFNDSQADELGVTWNEKGFEQRHSTGWQVGKIFYLHDETKGFFCKASEKKVIKARVQDLAKTDPQVKAFMPKMFTYEIKALGEFETIEGYKCEKYEVIKSGFLKSGASAFVWISEELKLRPTQLNFETEWTQILAAMPLQYGFTEGAVLKARISEPSFTGNGMVDVTYEMTEIKKEFFPINFLKIPEGYSEE